MCDNVHNEVYTVNDGYMQVIQRVSLNGSKISDKFCFITEFGDLAPSLRGET